MLNPAWLQWAFNWFGTVQGDALDTPSKALIGGDSGDLGVQVNPAE